MSKFKEKYFVDLANTCTNSIVKIKCYSKVIILRTFMTNLAITKLDKELTSLIFFSTRFHTFAPRFVVDSVRYCVVCKIGLARWVLHLKMNKSLHIASLACQFCWQYAKILVWKKVIKFAKLVISLSVNFLNQFNVLWCILLIKNYYLLFIEKIDCNWHSIVSSPSNQETN